MKDGIIKYQTGWEFPIEEEIALMRAGRDATKWFMEKYGKTQNQPQIDKSHYIAGIQPNNKGLEALCNNNRAAKTGETVNCPMCGRPFVKRANKIFCSIVCRQASLRTNK